MMIKQFGSLWLCLSILNITYAHSCVGNNYEQQVPSNSANVALPLAKFTHTSSKIINEGTIALIGADASVDNNGFPFFYWCAEQGNFLKHPNSPDYRQVYYVSPMVSSDMLVKIWVKVGDTLGYIDTNVVTVTVQNDPVAFAMSDKPSGELQIILDNTINLVSVQVLINNQQVPITWSGNTAKFNLYQVVGDSFQTFSQPAKLQISDSIGSLIYSGCFPFKDVCESRWYTRSVIKLWKGEIVEGYNEGKSATFGTYNPTTRAEFVAALVRALEKDNIPEPLTNDPFADVSKDDWYAPYVDYAAKLGLIQGCDQTKNLFCPNDSITRAEAMKILVLAYPHLKQLAVGYAQGKTPKKVYSDVTDSEQWYYPYIYAAQEINVAYGYRDGTFKPHSPLNRAEMAKVICIAEFGMMACIDMGDRANKSLVLTTSPYKAQLNEVTTFTVYGINLTESMSLSVQDCNNITRTEHTAEQQTYTCTPSSIGTKTIKVKDETGKTIYPSTVIVEGVVEPVTLPGDTSEPPTEEPSDNCSPSVDNITPSEATLGELTTFTVSGQCLSEQTTFYLNECIDTTNVGGNSEERQFNCTPGYKIGSHEGDVKERAKGTKLSDFSVDYQWGTPRVDKVTPKVNGEIVTTIKLYQVTDFEVEGASLLDTTAFYIKGCEEYKTLGGDANKRSFQCKPMFTSASADIQVKDQPDGNLLYSDITSVVE